MGKTTTCALLAAALGGHGTEDGRNTLEGVAATLTGAPPGAAPVVVELAMRGARRHRAPGRARPADRRPDHGDRRGPRRAARRPRRDRRRQGRADRGAARRRRAGAARRRAAARPASAAPTCARSPTARAATSSSSAARATSPCCARRADTVRVRTAATQPHNLRNVVATVALLRALGAPVPGEIAAPLPPFRWQPGRIGEVELVLDCANSSPPALAAALASFAAEPAAGRRIAVLGLMADLGDGGAGVAPGGGRAGARAGHRRARGRRRGGAGLPRRVRARAAGPSPIRAPPAGCSKPRGGRATERSSRPREPAR